ncbi:MAG: FkbM family methyltransferase, partial [Verrucomicrobiota bacterium]|nr:FkbM family methyltransferase [Verrucomicrobiota bacterium]
MTAAHQARRLGNALYKFGFPVYRPLYRVFKSYADRAERQLLRRLLANGSIVIDAGANIGVYSQFLSACVGPAGVVHSFEPDPLNCERLRTALSGFSNIRINKLAVSDQTGDSLLYVSDDLNVDHRAYPSPDEDRRTVSIETTRLDDYVADKGRVDLLKLDIQGYELHALRGAQRVLADNPAIKILFEFWPYGLAQAGTRSEELVSYLQEQGFILKEISSDGLGPIPSVPGHEDRDW